MSVLVSGTATQITDYVVEIVNKNTIKIMFDTSPVGTQVDVMMAFGNQLMIQGEQIKFTTIDLATGTISGLTRGVNDTIVNDVLYENSPVVAVLDSERLDDSYYDISWYENYTGSDIDYPTNDIPQQLTSTKPADFLNTVV